MSGSTRLPSDPDGVRAVVRERYGTVVARSTSCCSGPSASAPSSHAERIGYSATELEHVPDGANLGLGCGNPTALASLREGEVVVDLGAGAGIDAFIAARAVGPTGRVIGVDMTPQMLAAARAFAVEQGVQGYVEFREGFIEELPVATGSADVVISNCVINLSPDKSAVFREAFRVLKPGGRLAVSDIVLTEALPPEIAEHVVAWVGCLAGAMLADDYLDGLREAGFVDVAYTRVPAGEALGSTDDPLVEQGMALVGAARVQRVLDSIWSYKIEARKP